MRECSKVHNVDHYDLQLSQDIIMVIQTRRMRLAEHVAGTKENKCIQALCGEI
jgi:hypothetical protein